MPIITLTKEKDKTKKKIEVPEGTNLRDALLKNGIEVHEGPLGMDRVLNCGGRGGCATCCVLVKEGMDNCSAPSTKEKLRLFFSLAAIGNEDEIRLSCQTTVNGDITIVERHDLNWHGDQRRITNTRASNVDEIPKA